MLLNILKERKGSGGWDWGLVTTNNTLYQAKNHDQF